MNVSLGDIYDILCAIVWVLASQSWCEGCIISFLKRQLLNQEIVWSSV